MAIDLTTVPWKRLSKLAPPGTTGDDLQEAAQRYVLNGDVYSAAADLWEDRAMSVDLSPDPAPVEGEGPATQVASVSQDGISVTYANALNVDSQTTRMAQRAQMLNNARRLRAQSKPTSPLVHTTNYDPWVPRIDCEDNENIIVVDEV